VVIADILKILTDNVLKAQHVIAESVSRLPAARSCACASALEHAIITDRNLIPHAAKRDLSLLLCKYL